MNDQKITINLLGHCKDTSLAQQETTWADLCEVLSGKEIRKGSMPLEKYLVATDRDRKLDKDGPGWVPCSLRDPSGPRTQVNMNEIFALVLDIDTGMSLLDVKSRIAGYEAAIHSSYSHSLEKPKWRVVLPLKAPIPAKRISTLYDFFQEKFDGLLDDSCGHDCSRMYYLPACPSNAVPLFEYEHLDGEFLDGQSILSARATMPVVSAAKKPSRKPRLAEPPGTGVAEGGRNADIFSHACSLFADGQLPEAVLDACLKRNEGHKPPLDESEVKATVSSAEKHVEKAALVEEVTLAERVEEMNLQYAWVEKQGRVYRFNFRDFVPIDLLRQQYVNEGMYVKSGNSMKWLSNAELWHRSPNRRTHANVNFMPGEPLIVDNCINLWEGWSVTPATGDITPWNDMLNHLFGEDAAMRWWFEQWVAYPLQNPGAKLSTAVVLWSGKQGVGKSMIGETIGKLYGKNFRTLTSAELHASFNGWMRDCQFALGEENSSSSQRDDSNRLKFLITGASISVNEKFQPAIELNNCANFLFTSNHADAFYLEDADRRYFVWEITADRKPDEFFTRFVEWRDDPNGIGALMDYLLKLDLTGFLPKGNAPVTEAKRDMIRNSKTDLERWLEETLEDTDTVLGVLGKEVINLEELTEVYSRARGTRTSTNAVSRAFGRRGSYAKRRVMTTRRVPRRVLFSVINHEKWEAASDKDWAAEYDRPVPLGLD